MARKKKKINTSADTESEQGRATVAAADSGFDEVKAQRLKAAEQIIARTDAEATAMREKQKEDIEEQKRAAEREKEEELLRLDEERRILEKVSEERSEAFLSAENYRAKLAEDFARSAAKRKSAKKQSAPQEQDALTHTEKFHGENSGDDYKPDGEAVLDELVYKAASALNEMSCELEQAITRAEENNELNVKAPGEDVNNNCQVPERDSKTEHEIELEAPATESDGDKTPSDECDREYRICLDTGKSIEILAVGGAVVGEIVFDNDGSIGYRGIRPPEKASPIEAGADSDDNRQASVEDEPEDILAPMPSSVYHSPDGGRASVDAILAPEPSSLYAYHSHTDSVNDILAPRASEVHSPVRSSDTAPVTGHRATDVNTHVLVGYGGKAYPDPTPVDPEFRNIEVGADVGRAHVYARNTLTEDGYPAEDVSLSVHTPSRYQGEQYSRDGAGGYVDISEKYPITALSDEEHPYSIDDGYKDPRYIPTDSDVHYRHPSYDEEIYDSGNLREEQRYDGADLVKYPTPSHEADYGAPTPNEHYDTRSLPRANERERYDIGQAYTEQKHYGRPRADDYSAIEALTEHEELMAHGSQRQRRASVESYEQMHEDGANIVARNGLGYEDPTALENRFYREKKSSHAARFRKLSKKQRTRDIELIENRYLDKIRQLSLRCLGAEQSFSKDYETGREARLRRNDKIALKNTERRLRAAVKYEKADNSRYYKIFGIKLSKIKLPRMASKKKIDALRNKLARLLSARDDINLRLIELYSGTEVGKRGSAKGRFDAETKRRTKAYKKQRRLEKAIYKNRVDREDKKRLFAMMDEYVGLSGELGRIDYMLKKEKANGALGRELRRDGREIKKELKRLESDIRRFEARAVRAARSRYASRRAMIIGWCMLAALVAGGVAVYVFRDQIWQYLTDLVRKISDYFGWTYFDTP